MEALFSLPCFSLPRVWELNKQSPDEEWTWKGSVYLLGSNMEIPEGNCNPKLARVVWHLMGCKLGVNSVTCEMLNKGNVIAQNFSPPRQQWILFPLCLPATQIVL